MAVNVLMPQLGESVVEGTIVKWLVREGDTVKKDQAIVEIATDKADSEVPSPTSGVLTKILVPEGQTIAVNSQIAVIEAGAAAAVTAPTEPSAADQRAFAAINAGAHSSPLTTAPAPDVVRRRDAEAPEGAGYAGPTSPAVRNLAREHGVDLARVKGTGEHGRVTKQDVLDVASAPGERAPINAMAGAAVSAAVALPLHAERAATAPSAEPARSAAPPASTPVAPGAFRVPKYVPQSGDEIVPFSQRRRIIADHMVYSKHVAPHVMTIAEIDMQRTHRLREAKKGALKAEGIGLTFLSFIAAATVRALRENPLLNARVLDGAFVKLKRVNLGIAVETPSGLVVPVVRDADNLTVRGLARAIDEVAAKARDGKITPDDLAGATFTISNPGLKGNFVGAAIISQPNVGILRIGEIVKRPVVVEVEGQDTIAIHPVMFAALSYDHRIVDGVAANNFLFRVSELLEAGDFEI